MHEIALTRDAAADAREIEELESTVAALEQKAAEASRITELQTSVEALEAEVQQFRAERLQRGRQVGAPQLQQQQIELEMQTKKHLVCHLRSRH